MLAFALKRLGDRAAGGADRLAHHLLDDLRLGRPGHRHRRRGRAASRHRGDPQVLRLRPARSPSSISIGSAARCAGDFGRSYTLRQPVADVIFARLPVTMILGACAIAFALVLAIPLGVLAAVRPNSFADRFALTLAVVGQAMPTLLVRADLDPLARRHLAAVAHHRLRQLAELRHAGDRARLLRDAGGDAADACRACWRCSPPTTSARRAPRACGP